MLEWFGYVASVVVATSLLMNSLLRLRWINLGGALLFAVYGALLGAWPVFGLNLFIVFINAYYLYQIYTQKEYFKLLEVRSTNLYLQDFLAYYRDDIQRFFPGYEFRSTDQNENYFVLRNMQVVGLFLARRHDAETLLVELDYAVPEYRDFKLANFIFKTQAERFRQRGYTKLYAKAQSPAHNTYLRRIGFTEISIDEVVYFLRRL